MESLKLLAIFVIIVFALRRKLSVGITLFGAGLLTALLYRVPLSDVLESYWELILSRRFISLTAVIILITILGGLLRELGYLERLTAACRGLYGGRRTAAATLPPLVGLMPMPGGSLLSAPLVSSVLTDPRYQPHFKHVVNYWSRHAVEFFMPIYPGIIVSEAMTGMPIGQISLMQFPMALFMALLGYLFYVRFIDHSKPDASSIRDTIVGVFSTVWPVLLTVSIYGIFKIEMAWGALISTVLLVLVSRPNKGQLLRPLKDGLSYKLVFLVFGILSFQMVLDQSGAVASIQNLSVEHGFPVQVIIVLVSFTSGLLTGMLAALVALSYSLLAGFLYQPEIIPGNILLAFVAGYIGMMVSPTHLCLTLTNEYFGSDLLKVLKMMAVPLLLLGALGYLLSISPWPGFIYP
jgi:integral membrane protein (TIGR00529 family)